MIRFRTPLSLLAAAGFIVATASAPGQAPESRAYLLNVSRMQTFTAIGSEDKTKAELVEDFTELAGNALKVAFSKGDSAGDRVAKVKNWKPFDTLRFNVFSPGKDTVKLGLNIFHARSTNYQTRIEVPVVLKPGKNEVSIGIHELRNTNGSAPALADIRRWYFADADGKGPTVYFGDMVLERTVAPVEVRGDPARLARIRAAAMPRIDKPILFDTPEADAIVSALEVFPPDNPWNLVIEDWPVHPNSKNIIESIGANKKLRYNTDMGYVLVPPGQKKIDVRLGSAAAESEKGPYPVPDNTPIEGYPINYKGLTLDEVQRKHEPDSDRHAMVVDPTNGMLYEFYQMRKTDKGWIASGAAIFDLKSNKLRPDGWTSADAAGLPIFPATVRYDEIKRGHGGACHAHGGGKTRRAYVYSGDALRQQGHQFKPAAHGRAPPAEEEFRYQRLFAGGAGDPEGPEEIRRVRGGQRARVDPLGRARFADSAVARGVQQDQGIGVRGGGTRAVRWEHAHNVWPGPRSCPKCILISLVPAPEGTMAIRRICSEVFHAVR